MLALIALAALLDCRISVLAADVPGLIRSHSHEEHRANEIKGARKGADAEAAPKKAFVIRPGGGLQKESFILQGSRVVSGQSVMQKIRSQSSVRLAQLRQMHRRQMMANYFRLLHLQTPAVVPMNGILAWFPGANCSATWPNAAPGSTAAAVVTGAPISGTTVGKYISGLATDSISFGTVPQVLGTQAYTVCTVSSYANSSTPITSGRVFGTSAVPTWFQGQSMGFSGIAMYGDPPGPTAVAGGFVTSYYLASGTPAWTVMCGTGDGGSGSAIYVNGPGNKGSGVIGINAAAMGATNNIVVGSKVNQGSETAPPWNFMELISWNRTLSAYEINPIMNYLMAEIAPFVPTTTTTTTPNITKASAHRTSMNLCSILVAFVAISGRKLA